MFTYHLLSSTLCLKNVPPLTCYNLYIHGSIATIFGTNVAEKVGNQNVHETQLKISPDRSWTTLHCQNDGLGAADRTSIKHITDDNFFFHEDSVHRCILRRQSN